MKIFITLLFILVSTAVDANTITVGGTKLQIPSPPNFATVTPQMAVLHEYQKQFVVQSNVEFITFISETEVPMALRGEIPELERRFSVQTAKTIVNNSVSKSAFSELKETIKTQNDEILKKAEKDIADIMGKINTGISDKYEIDLALSVSQIVPLPAHMETDRILAYSSFVKYNMNDESGNPAPFVVVVTATFVHVKGKVLFLYSYAEEAALDWSKSISNQWASAIVEANPSDFQSSVKELLPSAVTGIDWGKVGAKAVGGAILGLLIVIIGWVINRRKAS